MLMLLPHHPPRPLARPQTLANLYPMEANATTQLQWTHRQTVTVYCNKGRSLEEHPTNITWLQLKARLAATPVPRPHLMHTLTPTTDPHVGPQTGFHIADGLVLVPADSLPLSLLPLHTLQLATHSPSQATLQVHIHHHALDVYFDNPPDTRPLHRLLDNLILGSRWVDEEGNWNAPSPHLVHFTDTGYDFCPPPPDLDHSPPCQATVRWLGQDHPRRLSLPMGLTTTTLGYGLLAAHLRNIFPHQRLRQLPQTPPTAYTVACPSIFYLMDDGTPVRGGRPLREERNLYRTLIDSTLSLRLCSSLLRHWEWSPQTLHPSGSSATTHCTLSSRRLSMH